MDTTKTSNRGHSLLFPMSKLLLDAQLIEEMAMSVRTTKCLKFLISKNANLRFSDITIAILYEIPNMGKKSVSEFLQVADTLDHERGNLSANPNNSSLELATKKNELRKIIGKFKKKSWTQQILYGDLRFNTFLLSLVKPEDPKGISLKLILENIEAESDNTQLSQCNRWIEALSNLYIEVKRISNLTLCNTLKEFIAIHYRSAKKPNLEAIYKRFGIGSYEKQTLEACGNSIGITRERIRQIESKIRRSMFNSTSPMFCPGLDKALRILSESIGCKIQDFPKIIIDSNLSTDLISVDALLDFSSILKHKREQIVIHRSKNGISYIWKGNLDYEKILSISNKLYHRNGIADGKIILSSMGIENTTENWEVVVRCLKNSNKRISLDSGHRWWIPTDFGKIKRNRLINVAKIALSITNPIDVDDVLYAFDRVSRFRNNSHSSYKGINQIVIPSKNATLRFFDLIPNFEVIDDSIHSTVVLDPEIILSAVDLALYNIISHAKHGIVSRKQLVDGCTTEGISYGTVSVNTTYSPAIKHIGLDSFALIGRKVDSIAKGAHQEVQGNKPKRKAVLLSEWKDGELRIVVRVPAQPYSMVIGVPGTIKRFLTKDKYLAIDVEGNKCGTVGISEKANSKTLYGMGPYCHHSGLKEDDLLGMQFNLLESIVLLSKVELAEIVNDLE